LEQAINEDAKGRETGVCYTGRYPVMAAQIIQRPNNHAPRYDFVEILTIAAGVLFIVTIVFVL
jgi:hypothetical protein